MDRARDRFYRFFHHRAGQRRLVHALGPEPRICSIRDLSNHPRSGFIRIADARHTLSSRFEIFPRDKLKLRVWEKIGKSACHHL